jgi:hypothetical protein
MADIHAHLLRATGDLAMAVRVEHRAMVDRATVDPAVPRAMGVAALRVAAAIIQRPVAVDITRVAVAAGVPVAEVVDTPAVVAAIPAAEDMAEAIAKKLGDNMSPREAAT